MGHTCPFCWAWGLKSGFGRVTKAALALFCRGDDAKRMAVSQLWCEGWDGWAAQHQEGWNYWVNPCDKMRPCLVFFVIAVFHWPRVWTQILYAVLEWIFNYQNNGGRHGTGKISTHFLAYFWKSSVLERGGKSLSAKVKKNSQRTTEKTQAPTFWGL